MDYSGVLIALALHIAILTIVNIGNIFRKNSENVLAKKVPYPALVVIRLLIVNLIPLAVGISVFIAVGVMNPFDYYGEEWWFGSFIYWLIAMVFFIITAGYAALTVRYKF